MADELQPPTLNLYSGEPQQDVFPYLTRLFPTGQLKAAPTPYVFPTGNPVKLPDEFDFGGEVRSSEAFLSDTDTAALLVLSKGAVRFERYWLTGGRGVQWISWSVAKSFVSALIGIALEEGHLTSIEDPISDFVPELAGSAYDGVSIRAVLEMSSGARWNEDYSDPESDISRFGAAIGGGGSLLEFVTGMVAEREPQTLCQYNSADTQVLGHLLIATTGRSITDYMQEKLYTPLGMESAGAWLLDCDGVEMAFGGLNLTARDYAKFGLDPVPTTKLGGTALGERNDTLRSNRSWFTVGIRWATSPVDHDGSDSVASNRDGESVAALRNAAALRKARRSVFGMS